LSPASIYVYYKVDPGHLGDLRDVVRQLFAAIQREGGIQGRWQRRRDDPTTYMEVYPDVRDIPRLEALLARESERLRIDRYLAPGSVRRVELFVAVD
jgi:quinol monooxygenase YgiN